MELTIIVTHQNHEIFVKIKDTILMKKVIESCCQRQGINSSHYVLTNGNYVVDESLSALSNNITNGKTLYLEKYSSSKHGDRIAF